MSSNFFDSRDSHDRYLLNFESMVNSYLIFYHFKQMSKPIRNRRDATKVGQKLGKRIRSIRQNKKWTLEMLAERAGMHVTYLSSIEHGHRNPTLNVLVSLA